MCLGPAEFTYTSSCGYIIPPVIELHECIIMIHVKVNIRNRVVLEIDYSSGVPKSKCESFHMLGEGGEEFIDVFQTQKRTQRIIRLCPQHHERYNGTIISDWNTLTFHILKLPREHSLHFYSKYKILPLRLIEINSES